MPRRRDKVCIVGFTSHRKYAPWENDEFEIWGLNDLYIDMPPISNERLRWFQIHDFHPGRPVESATDLTGGPIHPRDPSHVEWLQANAPHIPIYFLKPNDDVPEAQVLDREAFFQYFSLDGVKPMEYFTNTISWMLALAIMEGFKEIWVVGVDMMMGGGTGSEYGWQRPSCEFFLGWARGAGAKVWMPDETDLLASAFPYGDTTGNRFRIKVGAMGKEYKQRLNDVRNQKMQMQLGEAELIGANNVIEWITRSWMPGDGVESLGRAPVPNSHKELPGPSTE